MNFFAHEYKSWEGRNFQETAAYLGYSNEDLRKHAGLAFEAHKIKFQPTIRMCFVSIMGSMERALDFETITLQVYADDDPRDEIDIIC